MERKILWVLSFLVIFILWLKLEPVEQSEPNNSLIENTTPSINKNSSKQPSERYAQTEEETPIEETIELDELENNDAQDKIKIASQHTPPDFANINDIRERKDAFFNYLLPFVIEKNSLLVRDREKIYTILASEEPPSREDKRWLKALREIFKLEKVDVYTHESISELLLYVDIIPESLVLAQAANESAWGTSRFALEGNNYFGQWCFRKGCGLVPEQRDDEAEHEVRRFKNARQSVFAYIDNLNINRAYADLREKRSELRQNGQEITGLTLASGLHSYSERGQDYIDEIESLISYNELWKFNQNKDISKEK
ncbi:glucosaminidase domain-containing protein [Marinomonas sp. 15G1-11]|uniref:Glucosaminidase domain-containing protein n=1 Tax=Marinomonas phaeophyticola TaxID=3004091 RepID=A0ABT4JXW9_9GAMM|nr:glucosaminidase domain-containing protein [Marinomonas sp. 15G1-11]MCZ2723246.1 glucosaminidase domain-containing protein [Marinomonas sp. 15G1-11]